jgi:hypothetical protein
LPERKQLPVFSIPIDCGNEKCKIDSNNPNSVNNSLKTINETPINENNSLNLDTKISTNFNKNNSEMKFNENNSRKTIRKSIHETKKEIGGKNG